MPLIAYDMKNLNNKKEPLELTIHIVSWILIFLFPLVFFDRNINNVNWQQYLNHSVVPIALFVVFYMNYFWLVSKYLFKNNVKGYIISNVIVIGTVYLILHLWLESVSVPLPPRARRYMPPIWIFYLRDIILLIFSAGLGAAIKTSLRWRQAEKRLVESEREKSEMELMNLKNQLNPHFLLNTLNNIYALIAFNSDKAQEAVQELSKLLRHVLYDNQTTFVPLEKEVEFLSNYIALMKIRLPKNVTVDVNFEDVNRKDILIAPLIFISLIENAFKHGISPVEDSSINISVSTSITGEVVCDIQNSNHPKNEHDKSGSGIGLEQVRKRLELLYPGKYIWNNGVVEDGKTYKSTLVIKTE
jgi:LytS/YehU family sensor histidine kinase